MWNYTYPDYLAHYGVLGMKWGVHRAKRASEKGDKLRRKASEERKGAKELDRKSADYRSKAGAKGISARKAKKYNKLADNYSKAANLTRVAADTMSKKGTKLKQKSKKIEQYHQDMGSSNAWNKVARSSTAKLAAESMVLGTYGALAYNAARSSGSSRGEAIVFGFRNQLVSNLTGGLAQFAVPRAQRQLARNYRKEHGLKNY